MTGGAHADTGSTSTDPNGPLLVLGPPRSSQSLLAFAAAQHPSCQLILDTSWLAGLGNAVIGVRPAATRHGDRSALGDTQSPEDFAAAAGAAARHLINAAMRPGDRSAPSAWVTSATIDSEGDIAVLLAMFPHGHIVHAVRHPDAVVHSLATTACGDGRYASRADGYRIWLRATTALVNVAHAYGSGRVTRIVTSDIHTDPNSVIASCLTPLQRAFDAACRRPLSDVTADTAAPVGDESTRRAAVDLYDLLAGGSSPSHHEPGDADHIARIWSNHHASTANSSTAATGDVHDRYRLLVQLATPSDATVAVISKGDPSLVDVPGRHCNHLPQDPSGAYLGHHPADSADAVAAITAAVRNGVRYLVIPAASSWWLDHYPSVAEFLSANARVTAHHESIATTYELPTRGAK